MTMTYKTVSGTVTRPDSNIGIRAKVTVTPLSTNHALTFTGDDRITVGPVVVETASNGVLPALKIPTNVDLSGLVWRITAEAIDPIPGMPKRWTVKNAVSITGTGTALLRDLAEVDVLTVDATVVASVSDYASAADASKTAAAGSATTAAGWADAAASSAADADTSADLADTSADTATTAASTATTKATEASTSATTATTKASEAAASASHAEDMAGAAEAVAVSNDTIIAGRINDPASATATALTASYGPGGTQGNIGTTQGDARYVGLPGSSLADYAIATRKTGATGGLQWTTKEELVARALGWVIVTDARYGASTSATDNSSAIAAAAASIGVIGGTLYFPQPDPSSAAVYKFASGINLDGRRAITLRGPGGQRSGGATTGAYLQFTGSGSGTMLSMRGAANASITGLVLQYTDATFTGYLVDAGSLPGTGDSAMFQMWDSTLMGVTASGQTATLLCVAGSNGGRVSTTHFQGGGIHVLGKETSGTRTYSNGWWFESNYHHSPDVMPFRNPGSGWRIGGVFEGLRDGRAGMLDVTSTTNETYKITGLEIGAETWAGDVTSATPSTWIQFWGEGLRVGGSIGGTAAATAVKIVADNCKGINLNGTVIYQCGTGVDFGNTKGHVSVDLRAVYYGTITPIAGTIPPGALYDKNDGNGLRVPDAFTVVPSGKNIATVAQAIDAQGGWTTNFASYATFSRVTTGQMPSGCTAFGRLTVIADRTAGDVRMQSFTGTTGITAVSVGQVVTPIVWVRSSVAHTADMYLQISNDNGSTWGATSSTGSVAITTSTTGWTRITGRPYTVVTGNTHVSAIVRLNNPNVGETFDVAKFGLIVNSSGAFGTGSTSTVPWVFPDTANPRVEHSSTKTAALGTNQPFEVNSSGTAQVTINGLGGGTGGAAVGDGTGNKVAEFTAAGAGFNGVAPNKPTLTYSRATETAAATQLRQALVALGLVTDSTTA